MPGAASRTGRTRGTPPGRSPAFGAGPVELAILSSSGSVTDETIHLSGLLDGARIIVEQGGARIAEVAVSSGESAVPLSGVRLADGVARITIRVDGAQDAGFEVLELTGGTADVIAG